MPAPTLTFHDDPAAFLREAGAHLAVDPVVNTVLATIAERAASDDAAGVPADPATPYRWWVVVRDGDAVVGAAMRTAPFEPFPLFLLPMPEDGARALARALHARGEPVRGVNGARPAADACAAELAALTDGVVREGLHTRLHRLDRVVPPGPARGSLRPAAAGEVDLVVAWFNAFAAAADEQAGRPPGSLHRGTSSPEDLARRVAQEQVWLWVDEDGVPVHLSAMHPPSFGAARIAPVYTPPGHRGRGYAGNTVAALSQRILDAGAVACLYTDQANPTSNRLYTALGYRPVVDMVDLVVA
ncbi:GNAT family N-acetyltransferase [Nocardioides sp. GXQ0305]|uniref:GNAT family N-acetyltransferase n=1 Tax=Nocardioides sp. GXQ0305 TaxID=3423912 RepID=UPI003D7D7DD1